MSNEYEGFLFPKPKRQKKRKKHGKNVINTKAGVCFLCAMEGDHSIKPTERHHRGNEEMECKRSAEIGRRYEAGYKRN